MDDIFSDNLDELASILGASVVTDSGEGKFRDGVEHMYKPRESVFGAVAADMVEAGWSIFPQEADGNRRPGTVNNEMIKWSEKYHLATRLPDAATVALWSAQCASLNVAVVLGPASGHTFVIDVDVVEEELSAQIQELAEKHLGKTPLRRVGRWPKIALVYRHTPEDEISGRSPKFVAEPRPENPDGLAQGLEIISSGQAMTFYGKHHRTGRYFTWLEGPPQLLGPDSAPVVTSSQVNDFMDEVDSIRPFQKSASFDPTAVSWEWDENDKIHIPRIRSSGAAMDWTEDKNGRVTDGREAYLTRLAFRIVTANAAASQNDKTRERLVQIVVEQFMATAETTGRWKGQSLYREAKSKVSRTAEKVRSGAIKPFAPTQNDKGEYIIAATARNYVPAQPRDPKGDSLDFLPPAVDPTVPDFDPRRTGIRRTMRIEVLDAEKGAFESRKISRDRTEVAKGVSDGLMKAYDSFWDEVYDTDRIDTRIHILKAPTGAGKTTRGIAYIAEDPRTKEDYVIRGAGGVVEHEGRCPILFLLPTYANIEELRSRAQVLNLDGSLSDEELRSQAADRDLIHEDDLPAKLAELRRDAKNAGLVTMIYQGKLKAGCQMAEKVKMAMDAGLGTSGFCKAEIPTKELDDRGKRIMEEKFCPHYIGCPAIEQKKLIDTAHVVFMPHAFLSLNIPDELKHVRAVVADERIHHLFLHTSTFDLVTLMAPRKPPKLTKKEKEDDVNPAEFGDLRRLAAEVVNMAFITGRCPCEDLARVPSEEGKPSPAVGWIDAAIRTCGASIEKDGTITPDIDMEDLIALCKQPTGVQVREEYRFWKIVRERVEDRIGEIVNEGLAVENPDFAIPRRSKGDREMRIQHITEILSNGEPKSMIRISWRETPNWIERPLLLLDASAAPDMISKIWSGKEVVSIDIPAALNVRVVCIADKTYSNASVIAPPSATAKEKVDSAKMLTSVRKAITTISSMYGWSRVVAGGSILVRRAVNQTWEGPHNVDWCHFGAMRGLDFAKYHAAAISVGRMELPVQTLDGLVAALTYDDDVPELPFDLYGNGLGKDGQSLRIPVGVQRVRMRSGHDINMPVPTFPGRWGRMIQKQYREEELLQFLGRLRPVYREGDAPIWFSLSSVIPEEVIVDDLINIDDLLRKDSGVWEAMRRCRGILDPKLAALVCDDIFSSPTKAGDEMKKAGMNPKTGVIASRVGWGIVAFRWKTDDGAEGFSFVRNEMEDKAAALHNAFKAYLGKTLVELEQVSQGLEQTQARGRKSDKIEDELGTLEERREKEVVHSKETAIEILMSTPPEAIEHLKRTRFGDDRPVPILVPAERRSEDMPDDAKIDQVNMIEAEARLAITKLWASMGYAANLTAPKEKQSNLMDFGLGALLMHAESGADVDTSYAAIGNNSRDASPEFQIMQFDEADIAIPY